MPEEDEDDNAGENMNLTILEEDGDDVVTRRSHQK